MLPTVVATRLARAVVLGALVAGVPLPSKAQSDLRPRADVRSTIAIEDGELAAAVQRALGGASRLLDRRACAQVLDDFSDAGGRRLRDVLTALRLSPHDALARMIFRDGREHDTCKRGRVAAFTGAGSRVVFVCGNRFGAMPRAHTRQVVIHEMLHTLGLGERPPTSREIDRVVARRCAA